MAIEDRLIDWLPRKNWLIRCVFSFDTNICVSHNQELIKTFKQGDSLQKAFSKKLDPALYGLGFLSKIIRRKRSDKCRINNIEHLFSYKSFSPFKCKIKKIFENKPLFLHESFLPMKINKFWRFHYPVDTGRKLNVHKTFRRRFQTSQFVSKSFTSSSRKS